MPCVISRMDPCPSDQYRRNVVQSRLHHGTHHQPRARPSRSDCSMTRVGIGYDSHRFTSSRPLILGGVTIPHSHGLAGHSDADAICHSLTDALLGAAGLGDIGQLFPDTDPAWKDADSLALLSKAYQRVLDHGWQLNQADITVIAEAPRLLPHLPAIRASLAGALHARSEAISVKGKTNEGMGWIGRGEGIATIAVATLIARESAAPAELQD